MNGHGSSRSRSRILYTVLLTGLALVVAAASRAQSPATKLTWYGQACFLLESKGGTRVVMDPIPGGIGYTPPTGLTADVTTVSHEHGDHNNVDLVGGKPQVLRGLNEDKKSWNTVTQKVKDVAIRSVGVYHDEEMGKKRGLNSVFVFDVDGVRLAHLGDLGHILTPKQVSEIGAVDVVLAPVGGFYTIDAAQATKVIDQLRPRLIVIPMHYKTDVLTIKELAPVDAFLAGKKKVRRETGNSITLPAATTASKSAKAGAAEIVVLNYK
jgi:L-ascorbate metabolism protein UlaG (beta-lactamase superfamily)